MAFRLFRISGRSMEPDYRHGDYVVTWRKPWGTTEKKYREGQDIVFEMKPWGTLVKRVDTVSVSPGPLSVSGFREHSVDSRRFGAVPPEAVYGRVILHISPPKKRNK